MRRNIALMLELEGYEVLTAENGRVGEDQFVALASQQLTDDGHGAFGPGPRSQACRHHRQHQLRQDEACRRVAPHELRRRRVMPVVPEHDGEKGARVRPLTDSSSVPAFRQPTSASAGSVPKAGAEGLSSPRPR